MRGGTLQNACVTRTATGLNKRASKERLFPERDLSVGVLNRRCPALPLVAHRAAESLEGMERNGGMPAEWLKDALKRRVLDALVAHDTPVDALAPGDDDLFELIAACQNGFTLLLGFSSFDEHFTECPLIAPPFAIVILPNGQDKKEGRAHAQHTKSDHPRE